jgi:hypothetical protein
MSQGTVPNGLALPDEDLLHALFHHVLHIVGDSFQDLGRKRDIIMALSPGLRMIYATGSVEMEVSNGGFNQYFWNPSGAFAIEAVEGYELIGAEEHAHVVRSAIVQFMEESPEQLKFHQKGTLEAFSESCCHTKLGDVDREFFRAQDEEPIPHLAANFVRQHPDQFDLDSLEACYNDYANCPLAQSSKN